MRGLLLTGGLITGTISLAVALAMVLWNRRQLPVAAAERLALVLGGAALPLAVVASLTAATAAHSPYGSTGRFARGGAWLAPVVLVVTATAARLWRGRPRTFLAGAAAGSALVATYSWLILVIVGTGL